MPTRVFYASTRSRHSTSPPPGPLEPAATRKNVTTIITSPGWRLGTGNAYVARLSRSHTQLSKLSMQSGVGDLYTSKGVSTSSVARGRGRRGHRHRTQAGGRPDHGRRRRRRGEPRAAPEAAKYKAVDGIENTARDARGQRVARDPGALVFHRNKRLLKRADYACAEKFFRACCRRRAGRRAARGWHAHGR